MVTKITAYLAVPLDMQGEIMKANNALKNKKNQKALDYAKILEDDRIIAIDDVPDQSLHAIPILKAKEFKKLVDLLTALGEAWLAFKFKGTIIVMWHNRAFTYHLVSDL
jgi:hypothetical protein